MAASVRVLPLLALGQFDTVIRELGAILESRMRSAIEADQRLYGMNLVRSYLARIQSADLGPSAVVSVVSGELRTTLAFVRNGFAHAIVEVERPRGLALAARMCRAIDLVERLGPIR